MIIKNKLKAEFRINENEWQFLGELIGISGDGICILSEDGIIIRCNQAFEELLSRHDIEGLHFTEILEPENVELAVRLFKEYMSGNKSALHEWLYFDGDKVDFNIKSNIVELREGNRFKISYITNIQHINEIKSRLEEEGQIVRSFMRSTNESTFILEPDGTVRDVNEIGAKRLNTNPGNMIGRNLSEFLPSDLWKKRSKLIQSVFTGNGPVRFEDVRDGICFSNYVSPLFSNELEVSMVLYSASDITEKKRAESMLKYHAVHDVLTGLVNRHSFLNSLKDAIEDNRQDPKKSFAVLFMDLDRFKFVNDTYGHLVGDDFLSEIAHRLQVKLGTDKEMARMGGDEFAVLLQSDDIYSDVLDSLKNIFESFQKPFSIENRDIFFSVSIGIVIGDARYTIPEQVLRDADTAMYKAKSKGPGKYEFFNSKMHEEVRQRVELESELNSAIKKEQLVLYYQPIVDFATGKLKALEALIRWNHPEKGLLSPDVFLPIAEDSGSISKITRYVISKVLRQIKIWRWGEKGLEDIQVNVNLSAHDFKNRDLDQYVVNLLHALQLPGESITFEITESVLMENRDNAVKMIGKLRALGSKVYLDDFGTGYSSLSYLSDLPIDGLKIDRSFVMHMFDQENKEKVVRSIIDLAENLELESVAEGVETKEQLEMLRALDCSGAQGYLFSKPVPVCKVPELLEKLGDINSTK